MSDRESQDQKIREIWAEIARRSPAGVPELCPDAEILSAHSSQMLSEIEKARWETHFSVCAACQEALAALAVAEEKSSEVAVDTVVADVVRPSATAAARQQVPAVLTVMKPRRAVWRWVAPAVAAGVLLAAWLGFRENRLANVPVETAQNVPAASLEQKPDKSANKQKEDASPANEGQLPAVTETEQRAKAFEQNAEANSRLSGPPQKNSTAHSAPTFSKTRRRTDNALGEAGAADGRASDAPRSAQIDSASKAAAQEPSADISTTTALAAKNKDRMVQGLVRGTATDEGAPASTNQPHGDATERQAAPGALQSRPQKQRAAQHSDRKRPMPQQTPEAAQIPHVPEVFRVEPGRAAPQSAGPAVARNTVVLAKQELSTRIFTPNLQTFWIAGPVGNIQHSSNGGLSVITQNSGVLADLLAGSAPSQTVCWIVGRAGTILLTTDGEHWSKVGAPGDQDWVGVRATDALHAMIWDKDQRHTYGTSDGGKTWTSVP